MKVVQRARAKIAMSPQVEFGLLVREKKMSEKITSCYVCKKEVAKTVGVCPYCGQKDPGTSRQKAFGGLTVVIAVIVGVVLATGGDHETLETKTEIVSAHSIEYQLAVINAQGHVEQDDFSLVRFRNLLQSISRKTGYNQQKIANITVGVHKKLREEYGKEVALLDLMEGVSEVLREQDTAAKYEEVLAGVTVSFR